MPTNLPPEYFKVEKQYKSAKTSNEKIALLEEMMGVIPKHKGTDKLRADLRKRLSKLKTSTESKKKTGKHESHFHIEKEGAGRVAVVGVPNVGKSALVSVLTHATPKVSESPYTTWTPTPGMMPIKDIQVQLIDTPPLSREHTEPELIDLIRTSDLILIIIDLQAFPIQELEDTMYILNEHKISIRKKNSDQNESITTIPGRVIVNKYDDQKFEEDFEVLYELLEFELPLVPVSAKTQYNFNQLKQVVFDELKIIRIYSKPPHKEPDMGTPFVLKIGSTIYDFAINVHKDFAENLKTARVWGTRVYDGQPVGRDHVLHDGDVVELHL